MYEDDDSDKTLDLIDATSEYALTGAMYVPDPTPTADLYLTSFAPSTVASHQSARL